jgi:hypothetical protein
MELPMNDPNLPLNSSPATEPVSPPPVEQEQDPKEAIDLNAIFPDSEKDLNQLFLDADMKQLLKNVSKNKSDLGKLNDRLWEENMGEEDDEQEAK